MQKGPKKPFLHGATWSIYTVCKSLITITGAMKSSFTTKAKMA